MKDKKIDITVIIIYIIAAIYGSLRGLWHGFGYGKKKR